MKKSRFLSIIVLALLLALTAVPTFGADSGQIGPSTPGPLGEVANSVLHADSPTAIEGHYIVVLKDGTNRATLEAMTNAVTSRGGKVNYRYENALSGFAAELPDKTLEFVLTSPNVALVEADQTVSIDVTWGLDRTDQRNLPLDNVYDSAGNYNGNGSGVHVYIIDTGIRAAHSEFSGRVGNGYDAIDGGSPDDCNGHGTHVAGTVSGSTYGMAPGTTVHGVRVLNCSGSGSNSGVIAGIDWVTNNHVSPAVANMSLGGPASSATDNAVNNSIAAGVTYAVAAGNDNASACGYSPARVNDALTVGSTTSSDARSSFSNYGSCVDIFAPGSSITSAWHTGNSATNTISGTSMASPHVAGAAALYLGNNAGASPATVFSALTSDATSGVISSVGAGSPNLLLYVGDEGGPPPPPPPSTGCDSLPEVFAGSLSGTGDADQQPNGTYYYSGSGIHEGCLDGTGSDFDLKLYKWSYWYGWQLVAQSISSDSTEEITYSGSSGYYTWVVESYSGSGSYTFGLDRP